LSQLGFAFVAEEFLHPGQTEFDHRNKNLQLSDYRPLNEREIRILEANLNEAENWKDLQVKRDLIPIWLKIADFWD